MGTEVKQTTSSNETKKNAGRTERPLEAPSVPVREESDRRHTLNDLYIDSPVTATVSQKKDLNQGGTADNRMVSRRLRSEMPQQEVDRALSDALAEGLKTTHGKLHSEHLSLMEDAYVYISRRRALYGVPSVPFEKLEFRYSGAHGCGGIAHNDIRLIKFHDQVQGSISSAPASMGVHELAHMLAPTRLTVGAEGAIEPSQSGFKLVTKIPGRVGAFAPLFQIFEEAAASFHAIDYYKEKGAAEYCHVQKSRVALDPDSQVDQNIMVACRKLGLVNWEGSVEYEHGDLRVRAIAGNIEEETGSFYGKMIYGLLRLAPEMYKGDWQPESSLRNDIMEAQATGNLKPFMGRLREAFGPDGVRFLSRLYCEDQDADSISRDTLLLNLFADASALPAKERTEARKNIIAALDLSFKARTGFGVSDRDVLCNLSREQKEIDQPLLLELVRDRLKLGRISQADAYGALCEGIKKSLAEGKVPDRNLVLYFPGNEPFVANYIEKTGQLAEFRTIAINFLSSCRSPGNALDFFGCMKLDLSPASEKESKTLSDFYSKNLEAIMKDAEFACYLKNVHLDQSLIKNTEARAFARKWLHNPNRPFFNIFLSWFDFSEEELSQR